MNPDSKPNKNTNHNPWHSISVKNLFEQLDSDEEGLTQEEAGHRQEEYGPNKIRKKDNISPLAIFLSQFQDFLIYLLIIAALLSLAVGFLPGEDPNYVDAGLIFLILIANGIFGFIQDYRAEKAMEKLQELSTPDATVMRNGEKHTIDATEVVPGDIVVIEQGDAIPADARLIESTNLETMEAPLTGESGNVQKKAVPLDGETPLAERTNMVYMNTTAVKGRGKAVVTGTGMDTQVGGIATQIQDAEAKKTPFQKEVDTLGKRIGYGIIGLIVLLGVVQFIFTEADPVIIFLTGITLAVAAVPEGLPAIVTLTLALGSRKMIEKNALVRRLPVVESLGSVDVILTDKTGTLTENQMTVRRIGFGNKEYEVTGSGITLEGKFKRQEEAVEPDTLEPLLRCGAICNNAEKAPKSEDVSYYGDPTEVALLVSARKAGIKPGEERVREIPFSSDRKRMTVVAHDNGNHTAYMKGAPETILERCDRTLRDGEVRELTNDLREQIRERNEQFAGDALRVLGMARKDIDDQDADEETLEQEMVFLGLQGMIDPPREEVDRAVSDCRDAGIRVVMVTGDNLETAKAIGKQIGFDSAGAMTGTEVEKLSEQELQESVEEVEVFARVSPDHKVQILQALQTGNHRVVMTGDGVNDAPGVRNADVGVAMGKRGTDVTKEASDMVLQDDNFVTIRDAIAEGRGIFDNIRKFVNLLLSANVGEVLTVFVGVLMGSILFPELFAARSEALILTPVMLLWINLVTDGLPALAIGIDPRAPTVLEREPRESDEPIINRRMIASILTIGLSMTAVGLVVFFESLGNYETLLEAQTLLFTFFVVAEMGEIQVIRRRFGQATFSNRWLIAGVVSSLVLQLLVLYTPFSSLFGVYGIEPAGWIRIMSGFGFFMIVIFGMSLVYNRYF